MMVKDETICIRCGLCAERCPAHTITMEAYEKFEQPSWSQSRSHTAAMSDSGKRRGSPRAAPKSGETRREFLNEIAGAPLGIAAPAR